MLQPVEFLPGARASMRRAVRLEAEVIASAWDAPRVHRIVDMSPSGLRLAAGTLLPEGEHVVVSFTPPGWWLHGELTLFARIAHAAPRRGERAATMGIELLDVPRGARRELGWALRDRPPPLPKARRAGPHELVWVDVLVTYTEDLGDRVNTFEVSEALAAIDDRELEPAALGGLLTGGRVARPRWKHAA